MRTITLELLRHGPPHNQLLSPLTDYLALCENHSAVSWRVPFEQNQMLYRLRALSYQMGEEPREFQVVDTAKVLGDLLGQIPGLTADLNRQDPAKGRLGDDCDRVTHLRLILSASELALLPFELATAPGGFPGAGQPLSLQAQQPVCITRETRRVAEDFVVWPRRPRVLFAYAAPPGLEAVPAEAHLLALRQALIPWLGVSDDAEDEQLREIVAERLTVVPDATVTALEAACSTGRFTHVHILAHGVESRTDYDVRYGLALHASTPSGREVVSGERLASILRAPKRNEPGCFTRPAVVTLASCNSGNVGSITGVGASIGHALHEAGVPLVVASQFPLSFGASVMLVQDLYEGLLWGEDPRKLLVGLRRRLHARYSKTHDWASLTAYVTLPPDFEGQLANACIQQAMGSIDSALGAADRVLQTFSLRETALRATTQIPAQKKQSMLAQALAHVAKARRRLEGAMTSHPKQRARILAQLASTEKREAQLRFHALGSWQAGTERTPDGSRIVEGLELARSLYWDAYVLRRSEPWVLVQYLSLTLVLQGLKRLPRPLSRADQDTLSLWLAAEVQSLNDAETGDAANRAWAYSNLAELYLIAPLVDGLDKLRRKEDFAEQALDAARRIVTLTKASSFHVFSTRRQVLRYLEWFNELAPDFAPLNGVAEGLLDALPTSAQSDWEY